MRCKECTAAEKEIKRLTLALRKIMMLQGGSYVGIQMRNIAKDATEGK